MRNLKIFAVLLIALNEECLGLIVQGANLCYEGKIQGKNKQYYQDTILEQVTNDEMKKYIGIIIVIGIKPFCSDLIIKLDIY